MQIFHHSFYLISASVTQSEVEVLIHYRACFCPCVPVDTCVTALALHSIIYLFSIE